MKSQNESRKPRGVVKTTTKQPKPRIPWRLALEFCVIGMVVSFPWNQIVDSLASIRDILLYWPDTGSEIITAPLTCSYNVAVFVGSLGLTFTPADKRSYLYSGIVFSTAFMVLFMILCNVLTRGAPIMLILCLTCVALGIAVAFTMTSIFAFAAQFERFSHGASDATQAGVGFSGLFSFVLWLLLSRAIFRSNDEATNIRYSFVGVCAVLALLGIGSLFATRRINPRRTIQVLQARQQVEMLPTQTSDDVEEGARESPPNEQKVEVHSCLEQTRDKRTCNIQKQLGVTSLDGLSDSCGASERTYSTHVVDLTVEKPWTTWQMLKATVVPVTNLLLVQTTTFLLFPNITPLQWKNLSTVDIDIRMGVFQVGNFLGRGAPLFLTVFHTVPRFATNLTVLARFGFFPLFYCVHLSSAAQIIYIFALAITSGLLITMESAYIVVAAAPGGPAAQSRAATWGVCSLLGGIALGVAIAVPLSD